MDLKGLTVFKGKDREKVIPYTFVIGIAILVLLLVVMFFSLTIKRTYKVNYSDSSNLDYRVYLKDNDYYLTKYLPKDKQYISSLIDYIDADFKYRFDSAENIGLDYSYYVVATLNVANMDGKSFYQKEDYLLNRKTVKAANKNFFINENIKINYEKYNKIAKEFIEKYGLTATANLDVSLYVNVEGTHKDFDKSIKDKGVIKLSIPLTNKTVDISMDYDLSNNKNATLQYRSATITNSTLFSITLVLMLIDVFAIAAIVFYIVYTRDYKTLYKVKLAKILKDYDRYVSETEVTEPIEDLLVTRSLRIEIIKSFESLMDIRDSLNKPILFHEEKPGEEAVFYIISEKIGYIYVMKAIDFKKYKKGDDIVYEESVSQIREKELTALDQETIDEISRKANLEIIEEISKNISESNFESIIKDSISEVNNAILNKNGEVKFDDDDDDEKSDNSDVL